MANSADITVYTLKEFAKKFQDFFRGEPKDIIIKWMDDNGNKRSETIPNVAKVTEFLHKNGVTQAEMDKKVSDYYKKVENNLIRDKVLKELHDKYMTKSDVNKNFDGVNKRHNDLQKQVNSNHDEAKKGIVSNNNRINTTDKKVVETMKNLNIVQELLSTMNYSDFEKRREATKAQFLGSGFLKWKNYLPLEDGGYRWSMDKFLPPIMGRKGTWSGHDNRLDIAVADDRAVHHDTGVRFNVNGIILKHLKGTKGTYGVKLPDAPDIRVINDNRKTEFKLNQGDIHVYADYNRNHVCHISDADDIINHWSIKRGTIKKIDSQTIRVYSRDDGVGTIQTPSDKDNIDRSVRLLIGAEYELSIEITAINGVGSFGLWNDGHGKFYRNITKPGVYKLKFIAPKSRDRFHVYSETKGKDHYIEFKNPSVRLVKPTYMQVNYDIDQNVDLLDYINRTQATKSPFRMDFWFKEVWYEDVSRRDVVFQFGDVNNSYNYKNCNVHASLEKLGNMGGYASFHVHDTTTDPYGFKWSKLSMEDKLEFIKNPDNLMFFTKDKYMQVRQRDRVVAGSGDWNDIRNHATDASLIDVDSRRLMPQGYNNKPVGNKDIDYISSTSIEGPAETRYASQKVNGYYGTFSTWARDVCDSVHKDLWGRHSMDYYMIPIALVTRYNNGIYHPVFNQAGTALIYYSGEARTWDQVPLDYITKLEDCFDPNLIAAIKSDGSIVAKSDKDAVYQSGDYKSKIKANDHFYNHFESDQIRDIRYIAEGYDINKLKYEYLDKLINASYRGHEVKTKTKVFMADEELAIDGATSNIGKYKYLIYVAHGHNDFRIYNYKKVIHGYAGKIVDAVNYHTGERFRLVYKDNTSLAMLIPPKHMHYYELPFKGKESGWTLLIEERDSDTDAYTNGWYTHREIIGDPRKLKERVNHRVDSDRKITLQKFQYVFCANNDKNNGTVGHYYRYIGDKLDELHVNSSDGDANKSKGHIDFSDSKVWVDLGNNGEVGGLNDVVREWGIDFSPNLLDQNGKINLPEYNIFDSNGGKYVRLKLNKKARRNGKLKILRIDTTTWKAKDVTYRCGGTVREAGYDALKYGGSDKASVSLTGSYEAYQDNYLGFAIDGTKAGDNTTDYTTDDMWKYLWVVEYETVATLQSSYTNWNRELLTFDTDVLYNITTLGVEGNMLQSSVMGKYRTGTRETNEVSDMKYLPNLASIGNRVYMVIPFMEGYRHEGKINTEKLRMVDKIYYDHDSRGGSRLTGTVAVQLPYFVRD